MAGVSGTGMDGVVALPAGPASQLAVLLRKRWGARWSSPAGRDEISYRIERSLPPLTPHHSLFPASDPAPLVDSLVLATLVSS